MPLRTAAYYLILCCVLPLTLRAEDKVVSPMPVVRVCVDAQGNLASAEIVESSNIPDIDAAALKVARASKYKPGTNSDKDKSPMALSCVKFRVKFVLRDGEPVPAG